MKLYFKEPSGNEETLLIAMVGQPPQDRCYAIHNEVGCPVL
jgi:hypothetical protein